MHIAVAHDPSRPLSVIVGNKVVQAVGTEFNVEITTDNSIELIVTDGVVMVGVAEAPGVHGRMGEPCYSDNRQQLLVRANVFWCVLTIKTQPRMMLDV